MRVLIIISLLFLGCVEAMACAGCVYERMLVWYPTLVCARLAVVPFLAINRLDFARVLGVFVAIGTHCGSDKVKDSFRQARCSAIFCSNSAF